MVPAVSTEARRPGSSLMMLKDWVPMDPVLPSTAIFLTSINISLSIYYRLEDIYYLNAVSTIIEVFSYYFINAMVTISAVIFIAGARTMVITTKIKQLQYYNQFNEIFVLSLFLLFTNIIFKVIFQRMAKREARTEASAGIGADVSLAE